MNPPTRIHHYPPTRRIRFTRASTEGGGAMKEAVTMLKVAVNSIEAEQAALNARVSANETAQDSLGAGVDSIKAAQDVLTKEHTVLTNDHNALREEVRANKNEQDEQWERALKTIEEMDVELATLADDVDHLKQVMEQVISESKTFKHLSFANREMLTSIVEELYQLNNTNNQPQATTMSSIMSDFESTFKANRASAHAVNCVGAFHDHVRSGILRAVDLQRSGTSPEEV